MRLRNRAPLRAYRKTTYNGGKFNWRTRAMLMEMSQRMYGDFYALTILQGSYNSGVSASAGTHDGGGAVDLSSNDGARKVKVGRDIGFAIWLRQTLPGEWEEHVHGIAIGDKQMSIGAHAQQVAYFNGRNGLANNGPCEGCPQRPQAVFNYQAWRKRYNKG